MLGGTEGRRRRGRQRAWLDGITNAMDMKLGKLWEMVKDRDAVHGVAKSQTRFGDRTTAVWQCKYANCDLPIRLIFPFPSLSPRVRSLLLPGNYHDIPNSLGSL